MSLWAGVAFSKDVCTYARNLVALLRNAKEKDQRLTALKLVDLWLGKGVPALRLSYVRPPDLNRSNAEKLIVELIMQDYLKEDFHFTPYSTISYVVPGELTAVLTALKYFCINHEEQRVCLNLKSL